MANINLEILQIGQQYTAVQIAEVLGYQSHQAIVKGVVTPRESNIIILLVTKEHQKGVEQYVNEIRGNILWMAGQKEHGSDKRLLGNLNTRNDNIYLFYRDVHHIPYTYYGQCYLIDAQVEINKPSVFQFLIGSIEEGLDNESDIMDYFVNIPSHDNDAKKLLLEGAKKVAQHVRYERNPNNRKEAIRIQGHTCKICGFDFNRVYGEELAEGYIEVHHIKPLSEGEQEINPSKDLLPVCANCHRMLHRRKRDNIHIENLRSLERVRRYRDMLSERCL